MVWLCDQEPVRTFQKGPPPEKAKLQRWWTYLSQLRLSVHHIQGVKNECADYISRNNFDDMIGARSEELAKEAFSCMDVHLDLSMTMIRPLDGLPQVEYLKEFGDIYKRLEKSLEPVLVNQEEWKRDKTYLWHEDRIVVPSKRILALLKLTHEPSGHAGASRTLGLFKQWFNSTWTDDQLQKTLQPIVDKCPFRSCKPGDIRDRGLYSTLPIPHCAKSVLYVDYIEMPKFGGYDFAPVVTCGLTSLPGCSHALNTSPARTPSRYSWKSGSVPMGLPKRLTQTNMSEYAPTLAGTRESRDPSMSRCQRGFPILIRLTPM